MCCISVNHEHVRTLVEKSCANINCGNIFFTAHRGLVFLYFYSISHCGMVTRAKIRIRAGREVKCQGL